ncbi:MAG: sugar transferase [Micropruina sp.]|nr:sugar transferase [Micropruina sp.]
MTTLDVRVRAARLQFNHTLLQRLQRSTVARQTILALGDAMVLVVAVLAAYSGRFGLDSLMLDTHHEVPLWLAYGMPGLWILMIAVFGGYSLPHLQTGMVEYQRITLASGTTAGALGIAFFLSKYDLSRGFFILLFLLAVPALLTLRLGRRRTMKRLRTKGMFQAPVLVAGSPKHIDEVVQVLRREKWLGYQVIGAVTPADIEETDCGLPVLGKVCQVVDLVRETDVHTVIFAEGSFPDSQHFKRMAWELEEHDTQMMVVPALTDISSERLTARPVAGLPLVQVDRPQAMEAARWIKRTFDILGSSLFLLFASPILLAVAIAIKLEDGGSIFFKQVRVGRRGDEFECFKIRSMVVDAEARKAELEAMNEGNGVLFKMARDPRITRVGQFIRRFSIDEVPQFWNVLRGDMSLVGPRPALPREVELYSRDAVRRLDVRPGLTGLWQVSGRSDLSWDDTVRLDVYYVDNWSVMQDLSIMMRTAGAVLGSRGAY